MGIVGLGSVGGALGHTLRFFHDVRGYDVKGNHKWEDILETDIVFVCVPTPLGDDGRLNCDEVTTVLTRLAKDEYHNPVVVRSTLRVGFMDEATAEFPALRLVYSPEFLRERSRFQWSVCPDRLVLAGSPDDMDEVLHFFEWVEDATILRMDFRSAEVGKLAHNAFIATKVSFTNEIERICQELGADPRHVMDIVVADRRVASKEHLQPLLGPYGGQCVPKDTLELISVAGDAILLRAAHEVNESVKSRIRPLNTVEKTQMENKTTRTSPGESDSEY